MHRSRRLRSSGKALIPSCRTPLIAAIFACSAVSFSRGFSTVAATKSLDTQRLLRASADGSMLLRSPWSLSGMFGYRKWFSGRGLGFRNVLRGGVGLPNMPDSWFRKERLGIYSPYAQAAMKETMDHGMHQSAEPNPLQKLILMCNLVFTPSKNKRGVDDEDVDAISLLVENLSPADLGVAEPPSKAFGKIEYTEVFAGEHATICIFKLPAGAQLPMHDHPGMTVWSRVLWGEMAVHAFDRPRRETESTTEEGGGLGRRLQGMMGGRRELGPFQVDARRSGDVWSAESAVQVTGPHEGNIHQFTAVTPCCVLDVLAPPYDFGAGRPCTYYQVDSRTDGSFWARPVRCPDSYVTRTAPYKGIPATLEA